MIKKFFSKPLILLYVLFLVLGFGFGYYNYMKNGIDNKTEKKPEANAQVMAQNIVNPRTQFLFSTKYLSCDHTIETKRNATIDDIGLNEKQIKEKYKDWSLEQFDDRLVSFYRKVDGYCPHHFIVKVDDNGFIGVFKNDADKGLTVIQKTDIDYNSLSEKQKEKLKNDIVVDTQKEVVQILSDLSS